MCGIAGQIGYERNMRQMSAVMAQMSAAIAPRGPDASGIYVDDNAYLVHRRHRIRREMPGNVQRDIRIRNMGQPQ